MRVHNARNASELISAFLWGEPTSLEVSQLWKGDAYGTIAAISFMNLQRGEVMKLKLSAHTGSIMAVAMLMSVPSLHATQETVSKSSEEICEFVASEILNDSRMTGAQVSLVIQNGIAKLTGRVETLDQAERAADRVLATAQVRAVINEMLIDPKQAPTGDLTSAVRAALDQNKALDAKRIKISSKGDKVTLTGEVGTWDEQELARESVTTILGVRKIENHTEVVFDSVRTDLQIGEQIRQTIANDPLYSGLALTASVKDGMVKLQGKIGSKGEYDRLVRCAFVTGVFEVNADHLTIDSDLKMEGVEDKHFTQDEMVSALDDAISQDVRIDQSLVHWKITEGVIVLSGKVPTEEMKAAVESTARGIPNVLAVRNEIRVDQRSSRALVSANAPLVSP